ncbi:epoxide hydrolase 4-like [Gigantopelta aegis]|uniref:epoxide hydrolase 4-like n=1 Tax=Gigantopelta aegis TaxID=1735272 RepID=UPI001B888A79|nr:epoxide hydrolase 4-like [Gigantopelta aegis]
MAFGDQVKAVLAFLIGCVVSIYPLYLIVKTAVKHPFKLLSKKKRDEPPDVLSDPSLGVHGYIHLEEVKIHYVASGDEGKPLMLFVHGFPEFWYSWRHQIKEFQKDYRVVAIDQRGYGDSDHPSGVGNYRREKLAGDLKQMIPALGYSSCILVGHDWGGVIAWVFASLHPDMVTRLIVMNAPHPLGFQKYIRSHIGQLKKSWYIFFFQVPIISEFFFEMNDMKYLELSLAKKPLGLCVGSMSNSDIEAYKYAFSKSGFSGPINYYRASLRYKLVRMNRLQMPVLIIWGCQDQALDRGIADASSHYCDNVTMKFLDESSHYVQMDQPDLVNKCMRDFLKSE